MKETLKKILRNQNITIPSLILLLILPAYGLLVPWMGFYWDDLPFAWFLHFFGPVEFIEAFRPFRPLLGPIFTVTTSIFGGHPLTWQIIGLASRFLLGLGVWHLLRMVFPTRKRDALWAVLFFTVYPAYGQQWVAFTHVNQEIIPLLFLLSSFILSIWLLRSRRDSKPLIALALLLQALGLFSTEYFFGLEILRFFFLLAIFAETIKDRKELLQNAGKQWLPYFVVWIMNAVWTYSYHQSTAYDSYDVSVLSSSTLSPLALVNEFITTLSLSGFTSWLETFNIFSAIDGSATQALAFVILVVTAIAVYIVMQAQPNDEQTSNAWGWWAMGIGLVGIFAGRLPSWAAGLPLKMEFDYDRFFISIMLGASLFVVGLASLMLREGRRKVVILSILIGMSAAYQFTVANTFRRDWANQQDFFHQLAWRMPSIKENTALLTYELPLKYASDHQLTASLNWMYAPDLDSRDLPYMLLYLKTRFTPAQIRADQPIQVEYRTVNFNGSTSNSVVIYKEADGCLRVLDPIYGGAETVPGASFYLTDAIPLSNPNELISDSPEPVLDEIIFGKEPSRGWCYYYAKAELARQQGDWERVTALYKEAQRAELNPALPVEYLPFIEAFALTGDTETAVKLTERTIKGQPALCPALASLWSRVYQNAGLSEDSMQLLQKECAP